MAEATVARPAPPAPSRQAELAQQVKALTAYQQQKAMDVSSGDVPVPMATTWAPTLVAGGYTPATVYNAAAITNRT